MSADKNPKSEPANPQTEAILALVAEIRKQAPQDPNHLGLSESKIKELTAVPPPRKYRLIRECVSEETGSAFTLHVVESKGMPNGRITRLEDYKHPAGVYVYASAGGKVPDGMPICQGFNGQPPLNAQGVPTIPLNAQFKHWLWEEFWKKDLKRFVGNELKAHHCTGEGFKTPWELAPFFGHQETAAE